VSLKRESRGRIGGLDLLAKDGFGIGRQTWWESRLAKEIEVGQDSPSAETDLHSFWRQAAERSGQSEDGCKMLADVRAELIGLSTALEDGGEEPIVREAGPVSGDLEEIRFDNRRDFVPENGFQFNARVRGLSDGAGGGGIVEADVGIEEEVGESEPERLTEGDVHGRIVATCPARRR